MNVLLNQNKIKMLPVKLKDETFESPTWLADKQYMNLARLPSKAHRRQNRQYSR